MGSPDNKLTELVDTVKSWIPRRAEPVKLSRDFWMPDQSCRVCYECDSQFTVFNRRHHCRLCGRVFCARCTANSIPATSDDHRSTGRDDWERIRVCNYCFKQWEQELAVGDDNGCPTESTTLELPLSPSPSAMSLASSKSSCTCNSCGSTIGSTPYSTGPYQHVLFNSSPSHGQAIEMDPSIVELDDVPSGQQHGESSLETHTDLTEGKPLLYTEVQPKPEKETREEGQDVNKLNSRPAKNWSNLRKMILLNRFVKALEKVKDIKPRERRHLLLEPDVEPEKVSLKHQDMDGRKGNEEYLLDYALQQAVSRLTPARMRKVHLLVEAFETVTPPLRQRHQL